MPSFFTRYQLFESRLEAAVDAGDVKLIQILLGPKYCQLWQYWVTHAMISYNMLTIERTANCKLPLNIITKQINVLKAQGELLDKQVKFLEGEESEVAEGILETRKLLKTLFDIISDETKKYRKEIAQANRVVDGIHHLFHIPGEAGHIPHYMANEMEAIEYSNSQALVIRDEKKQHLSYESTFGCVSSALGSIDRIVKTKVVHECDLLIRAVEKVIDKEICQDVGKLVWFLHYLDSGDYWLNGDNGIMLDDAVNYIPEGIPVPKLGLVNLRSIARYSIIGFRWIVGNMLSFFEKYDDMSNSTCVKAKKIQMDMFIKNIETLMKDKQEKSKSLHDAENDIKVKILNQLLDAKPIDKYFVGEMYDKLFNRYLNYLLKEEKNLFYNEKFKPSELLRDTIDKYKDEYKNCSEEEKQKKREACKEDIKKKLLKEDINYTKFRDLIDREINKDNPNLDVVKVLIVNCAGSRNIKEMMSNNKNPSVRKLATKSINTIMMEVHNMLFDFNEKQDKTFELISRFPTKSGTFEKTSTDRIMFSHTGEEKFQDLGKELEKFIQRMQTRQARGQLDRYHHPSATILYFIFYDFFGLKKRKSVSQYEYNRIDRAMAEFCDVLTYATILGDQGIMYDYIEEVEQRKDIEKNEDIQGLYRVITGDTWTAWWNSWCNSSFKQNQYNYTIGTFSKEMEKAITTIIDKEQKNIKQGKEKAEQKAQENAQRAEQNAQRAEVTKLFGRLLRRSKLDDELCEVVEASEDTIVKAVVKQVMENNSPAEELLRGIMEEIRWKWDQIVNEGVVSDEIIENSIKMHSMHRACTSMSNLNVSQLGMSMGR